MSDDTKHEYDQYANEVQQVEWEKTEQVRKLRWVEDSLRQALAEFDAEQACPTCSIAHTDGSDCQRDASQAQHVGGEHTHGMAVTADNNIPTVSDGVKRIDTKGWGVGRGVTYKTGVVAPDGVEEVTSTMLCHRCDREAEYAGYCEEHYEQWMQEVADDEQPDLVWEEPESCPHCAIRGCEGQCHEAWDEELDDLMSREELERAEREAEEGRSDH